MRRTFGWRFSVVWLGLVVVTVAWLASWAVYSWATDETTLIEGLGAAVVWVGIYAVVALPLALLVSGLWQAVAIVRER